MPEEEANSRLPNKRVVSGVTGLIDGIGNSLILLGSRKDLLRARVNNAPVRRESIIIKTRVGLDMSSFYHKQV